MVPHFPFLSGDVLGAGVDLQWFQSSLTGGQRLNPIMGQVVDLGTFVVNSPGKSFLECWPSI